MQYSIIRVPSPTLVEFVQDNWTLGNKGMFIEDVAKVDYKQDWFASISDTNQVFGCIGVHTKNWAWNVHGITWLLVHPEYRGIGIGRRLVHRAMLHSKADGAIMVQLTTPIPEYYRRLGFKEIEHLAGYSYMYKLT